MEVALVVVVRMECLLPTPHQFAIQGTFERYLMPGSLTRLEGVEKENINRRFEKILLIGASIDRALAPV